VMRPPTSISILENVYFLPMFDSAYRSVSKVSSSSQKIILQKSISAIYSCKESRGIKLIPYLGSLWIYSSLGFGAFRSAFTLFTLFRVIGEVSRVFGIGVAQAFLFARLGVLTAGLLRGCRLETSCQPGL
jgi:hypothetical protein